MGRKYEPSVIDQPAKEKVIDTELLLKAILENNLLSIIVLKSVRDDKGTISDFEFQYLNRKAVESVRGRDLTGKKLLVEFPETKPSKIFDNYVYVVETGKSWEDEVFVTHEGHDACLSVKVTRLEDGCLVLYSDITAQKKIEQELFHIKDEVAKLATDKYLNLFNNIDQGFCIQEIIFDVNGKAVDYRFLEINPMFEKMTGLKNAVGHTIREFDPSLENIWFEKYGDVVKTGKSVHFQSKASGLLGGVWYDVYAFRIDKPEDRHVAVLFNDITAKKKAEHDFRVRLKREVEQRIAELKASKDLLKSVFDSNTNGMSLLKTVRNEKGNIIDFEYQLVNKATEQYNSHNDLAGKRYSAVHRGFYKTGLFDNLKKVVETGQTGQMELFYDDEGFYHWFKTTAVRFHDGVVLSFEDITDRKKSEIELKEQNHFIKQIADTTPDILFVGDVTGGNLIYASQGLASLGYAHDDFYLMNGDEFKSLIHPDDLAKTEAFNNDLKTLGPEEIREIMFRLRDGSGKYHWLNVRYRRFKASADGNTAQVLGIARDVTEKVETEMAFLEEKTRNVELKRINELMDTFVYAAAHDLKSPVSNLRLLTALISDSDDDQLRLKLQEKYAPILDILERTISGLVRVLEIEKDSGPGIRKIRFDEAFNLVLTELHDKIIHADAQVNADFSACESILYPDSYITSIFRNLLSNALKYRHPDKKTIINVTTKRSGNFIMLNFTDNGIGIDLENYGKDMFKPFKRFSSHNEGSGLGLHLVKSIVTKNGGRIETESEPARGTTFRIFLVQYSK